MSSLTDCGGADSTVLPTGGSDVAGVAAAQAIAPAGRFGADVHAPHVREDEAVERGEVGTTAVAERAATADVAVTTATIVADGAIHRVVIDYAADYDADCIVMGTHGRTGPDRYVLGSVTDRVVRLSDRPILTVSDEES